MRYWLLYIFLCTGCLANNTFAQEKNTNDNIDVVKITSHGDSLYAIGNYYEAALSFDQAAFFSVSASDKASLFLKMSGALKQLADYESAERALAVIDFIKLSDSLRFVVKYEAAFCAYLCGNFTKAELHLEELNYSLSDSAVIVNSYLLYTLILNEQAKWTEAKKYLTSFINKSSRFSDSLKPFMLGEVNSLYSKTNLPKLKNVIKAGNLSKILPGLGQMYAGYFWEGAGSFMFNITTLGLTVAGIYYHYYITSVMFGFATFERFYIGNTHRAELLAKKTNYKRKKTYNEKLKNYVLPYFN